MLWFLKTMLLLNRKFLCSPVRAWDVWDKKRQKWICLILKLWEQRVCSIPPPTLGDWLCLDRVCFFVAEGDISVCVTHSFRLLCWLVANSFFQSQRAWLWCRSTTTTPPHTPSMFKTHHWCLWGKWNRAKWFTEWGRKRMMILDFREEKLDSWSSLFSLQLIWHLTTWKFPYSHQAVVFQWSGSKQNVRYLLHLHQVKGMFEWRSLISL